MTLTEITKQRIIQVLNADGKNLKELKSILDWGKILVQEAIEQEDLKNESELNSFESRTYEG